MKFRLALLTTHIFIVGLLMSSRKTRDFTRACAPSSERAIQLSLINPISVKYLKNNLRKSHPRLVLTPPIEKNLKKRIKSDVVVKNYYAAIKLMRSKYNKLHC
jgi:hypothetical protein